MNQIHETSRKYIIDNGSQKYSIKYRNIYSYNNYIFILGTLFFILFIIYLLGVSKKKN